ncbi:MAG: nucleotidyltransferase domain-containing protein [Ignavibacteria bacterium]|nr:nucleotidyltransferase domain-containing protein [Ignavibacteria bacterium]MBK9403555.1 nucleotidyltransferase domain-containing protein [Ignavibacteria bacterium]MBL0107109.1 nucleotidyltransferase domain-containing protein [Ignavibacteria bacterium]
MITEKEKILNFLSNNKEKLTIEFGVNSIGLFGSYINNIQNRESDIDILIDVKDSFKNYKYYIELKRFLENNFGKKVDLVYKNAMNPLIKMEIQNNIIYV